MAALIQESLGPFRLLGWCLLAVMPMASAGCSAILIAKFSILDIFIDVIIPRFLAIVLFLLCSYCFDCSAWPSFCCLAHQLPLTRQKCRRSQTAKAMGTSAPNMDHLRSQKRVCGSVSGPHVAIAHMKRGCTGPVITPDSPGLPWEGSALPLPSPPTPVNHPLSHSSSLSASHKICG